MNSGCMISVQLKSMVKLLWSGAELHTFNTQHCGVQQEKSTFIKHFKRKIINSYWVTQKHNVKIKKGWQIVTWSSSNSFYKLKAPIELDCDLAEQKIICDFWLQKSTCQCKSSDISLQMIHWLHVHVNQHLVQFIKYGSLPTLENRKVSVFSKSLSVAILLPNSISGSCCFCWKKKNRVEK